eukprot:5452209-Pleurochrysis_carterae.AAC.2
MSKTEIEQPREKCTLPAPARLRHSVNGFFDVADARPSIGTEDGVSRQRVSGDEIPTPHAHAGGIGDRRERA